MSKEAEHDLLYGQNYPWMDVEQKVSFMESKIKSKIESVFGDFKECLDTIESAKKGLVVKLQEEQKNNGRTEGTPMEKLPGFKDDSMLVDLLSFLPSVQLDVGGVTEGFKISQELIKKMGNLADHLKSK